MEEKNYLLSKQIQEYEKIADDSFKIVQEKQKLVSTSFYKYYVLLPNIIFFTTLGT